MRPAANTRSTVGDTNVHADFHVPGYQREVGERFDPEEYAAQLDSTGVESVSFFAKCHHGYSYYDTDAGIRHPELEFDMLAAAIEACHDRGISVLAYYSLARDELAGRENPDWYQYDGDGRRLEANNLEDPRWSWICLNSPYAEEVVLPQVRELLEYDVDGFWFDILSYHEDACTCRYCRESMRSIGRDPGDADDRLAHRAAVCEQFAARTTEVVKDDDEDLVVTYNHRLGLGITSALAAHMDYVVIESLPAGHGGYWLTPMTARYARNLDRPVQGMTGIFHMLWGDFGTVKNRDQLRYELATSLSHHLPVSIGDQQRPRGQVDPGKYEVIGDGFDFARDRLPVGAEPLRDVAVVFPGDPDPGRGWNVRSNGAVGATKLLCETHQQFDLLDERLAAEKLHEFRVAVLPDTGALEPETVRTVREFVDDGGALVATGTSSLAGGDLALGDVLGIEYRGRLPYSIGYFDLERHDDAVPGSECVSYGAFANVATTNADEWARVVGPTTERSETRRFSHYQAPPERDLGVPAITHHEYGGGRAVYVGTDLFTQYYGKDYHGHRALADAVLSDVQTVRAIDADLPATVEVNAMRADDRVYLHATNYDAHRAGALIPRIGVSLPRIDEIRPMSDVAVRVRAPGTSRVSAVTDAGVAADVDGDFVDVTFEELRIHEIAELA